MMSGMRNIWETRAGNDKMPGSNDQPVAGRYITKGEWEFTIVFIYINCNLLGQNAAGRTGGIQAPCRCSS